MEFGENDKQKLQLQIPWLPTTPYNPILPRPVPIYTPGERTQLSSQLNGEFACLQSSAAAAAQIDRSSHRLPEPAAGASNIANEDGRTRVHVSFDNISGTSNSFSELLAQADAPSEYSYATEGLVQKKQFIPDLNLNAQFNQSYPCAFLGHSYVSQEQPFINFIQRNYQDPLGTPYWAYYPNTTSQVALAPENVITTKYRQVAVTEMHMQERDQGGEEKNAPVMMCNNAHNQLCDPVMEFAADSTPCKENHNHNREITHDIDLNKTPQSRPKRRKHRPKVIREGKPKRTTKPVTPKPVQSKENSTGKRKSARRKGVNTTPQTEVTGEWTKQLMPESAKKMCKRSLNFDTEEQPRDENSACGENATTQFCGEIGSQVKETHALNNYMSLQEDAQASTTISSKSDSPWIRPNDSYVEKGSGWWGWMIHQDGREKSAKILSKSVAQSSANDPNYYNRKLLNTGSQVVGSKRKQSSTAEHVDNSSINLIGAQYNLVQEYLSKYLVQFPNVQKKKRSEKGKFSNSSNTSSMTATKDVQVAACPQEDARLHIYASTSNGRISCSYETEKIQTILTARERAFHDKFQSLEYKLSLGKRMPTKRRSKVTTRIHRNYDTKVTNAANLASYDRQTFGDSERAKTCIDALVAETRASLTQKKRSKKRSTPTNSVCSCTNEMHQHCQFVVGNHSLPLQNSSDVACGELWKNMHTVDTLTERFRHLNIHREGKELVMHGQNALVPYKENKNSKGFVVHEYGTIIPFEGMFDPIKKQRPRPKVDLDEETNRVWKLLMLDINSHGIDGTDEDKAKWWEEERNVFRGRADSFIARMHLVQGDRRFSKWKGSVVDSVIGVFLTQNVSDHLSSSAFMSLAARFPLKPSSKYETSHEESTSLTVDKPQVQIVEPEENAKLDDKILNRSVDELSSMTKDIIAYSEEREAIDSNSTDSCRTTSSLISLTGESTCNLLDSAERHNKEHSTMECISPVTGEGQENSCHGGAGRELNTVISSQCSIITSQMSGDFATDQNPKGNGSFSDSYSEVVDLFRAAKYNNFHNRTSFSELLGMADSSMIQVNNQRNNPTENSRDLYGKSVAMKHDKLEENLEKSNVTRGSFVETMMKSNEHTLNMTSNSEVLEVNCCNPLKIDVSSSVTSKNKNENDKKSSSPPTEYESQNAIAQSHKQNQVFHISGESKDHMQKSMESDFGDHNYAMSNNNYKLDSAPLKLRGTVHGKEKKDHFNWDSLRIQAQAKAGKREKTESTMDSLDWDAVRRADVKEIADAIRERGMNNMLAERIKNFLNLLVEKHGGIDLEWLRDVPPDQAKEYLLSIRGLGLKSVECVRLLTLHHLAFPVDTNVGRIAVRLGWVPLQPLPESLQLHLLELYPVLESIQKYLWPRLCKLDQKTLYELHYQLITFGKVFCTKSKPNCNACPMRGECRHFASAFASARLALPGPEQKSIVTSITTGNNATDQNPSVIIKPLPLPLLENTTQAEEIQQREVIRQLETNYNTSICQPIIEEPASPAPESSQASVNDIEDALCEESGEIPTIKLDIEEFTMNLQNYMQENMELQEVEMSKALVALHPEAACIPTPKLKNMSRLRTEHSVYELPDSHRLLEGWDIREPDDPGKYLLAIWTPGETANSITPPERKCSFQDCVQLCNEKECFSCNSFREADSQTVRGTILIPCRTAMRGSFPLNGTYFQVNEVFADHESSLNPISVPRSWIWNLNRRTVCFGTSMPTIFKGLSTQEIQQCFWRGYVCVRGFDRQTRAPRPLMARLHFPASKLAKSKDKAKRDSTTSGLNLKTNLE